MMKDIQQHHHYQHHRHKNKAKKKKKTLGLQHITPGIQYPDMPDRFVCINTAITEQFENCISCCIVHASYMCLNFKVHKLYSLNQKALY